MKQFVVLSACMLLAVCVFQPAVAQPVWEIGVLGGISSAKLSGDTDLFTVSDPNFGSIASDLTSAKTGGIVGVFAMVNITPNVGIRVEGFGNQTGGKGDISGTVFNVDFTGEMSLFLNYVEVPVLFVGAWPVSEVVTLRGYAGPAFDFLANAKLEIELTALGQTEKESTDVSDGFKGTDISGVLGAEAAFTLGSVNILVDVRWTKGFTNVLDSVDPDLELKRSTWSFMAGLGFPIKTGTGTGG